MLENTPQSSGNYEVCGKGLGKACCKNGLKLIRYTIYWKQQQQQQKLGTYLLFNFITLLHRYLLVLGVEDMLDSVSWCPQVTVTFTVFS